MIPKFLAPTLTPLRIRLAYGLAIIGDAFQLALGPLGWSWLDEIMDVALAVLMIPLLGFHPLLLPTFLIELFPVADMMPTWTGCVALVVMLRKKEQTGRAVPEQPVKDEMVAR